MKLPSSFPAVKYKTEIKLQLDFCYFFETCNEIIHSLLMMARKTGVICRKFKGPLTIAFFLFFCALYILFGKLNLNM